MSTDYSYDEQGQFFPFFIGTVAAIVTIPLTISLFSSSDKLELNAESITGSEYKPEDGDIIPTLKRRQRRRERKTKRGITVVVGWAVVAYMIYLIIVTQRIIPKIWDPYSILDVSRSASDRQIKSAFRKLTLKFHPDKLDITKMDNVTLQEANDHYVEITKAYKALTDEEVRNNYLQYGHPDGKQSFSIGIALPKFIVTEGNGKFVLMFYGALLGVLLPITVGKWWYGTQKVTKDKVLIKTAGDLFQEYNEQISTPGVVSALSVGEEYQEFLKGKSDVNIDQLEKAISQVEDQQRQISVSGMGPREREKFQELDGTRRKALALLWAHLGRLDLKDSALTREKFEAAPTALRLNEAFITICLAFGTMPPLLGAYGAGQRLIQAIPPSASPLLQLPYVTKEVAQHIEGGPDVRKHWTVQQFMDLPKDKRRALALGGGLSATQYDEAVAVGLQIPFLRVEKCFFKCIGEKVIIPGSLVEFVMKARFIPPGTTDIPSLKDKDLSEPDPDEEDLDAMLGRKQTKEYQPALAHAPFFARDHSPRWQLFLAEPRQGRIAVPPITYTTFDKPIFADGKPTFEVQTLKLKFQAPGQAGSYTFMSNIICDSYIGMDTRSEATLVVEEAGKAAEIESEDEISEPDEDSLAGQMSALKSGGAPPPKKKKKAKVVDDSDESGTDEDEEETSDTDTETDTDEE